MNAQRFWTTTLIALALLALCAPAWAAPLGPQQRYQPDQGNALPFDDVIVLAANLLETFWNDAFTATFFGAVSSRTSASGSLGSDAREDALDSVSSRTKSLASPSPARRERRRSKCRRYSVNAPNATLVATATAKRGFMNLRRDTMFRVLFRVDRNLRIFPLHW